MAIHRCAPLVRPAREHGVHLALLVRLGRVRLLLRLRGEVRLLVPAELIFDLAHGASACRRKYFSMSQLSFRN